MPPHEFLVRVPNVDRKGFCETKAELLEQVFVRGGGRVRVTVKSPSLVLLPSDGGKLDDTVRRLGGHGSCIHSIRIGSVRTESEWFTGLLAVQKSARHRPETTISINRKGEKDVASC